MHTWNPVAIMQLRWEIVTKRESMWVSWCNMVLLKDKSFWVVKITAASSWSRRNVLRLKECLARNLVYNIGNGRATSLWSDPWINGEALTIKYGARVANYVDILIHTKVSAVFANRQWAWLLNSLDPKEIDTLVRQKSIEKGPDVIQWLSKGKSFSCKVSWQVMLQILPKVALADIVWFLNYIFKHNFCFWLTSRNAHRSTDKLRTYGVVVANQYMFGYGGLELQLRYGTNVSTNVGFEGYADHGWRKQHGSRKG
ncbi:zf-RVT domain-containing protein [Cephalotus follicularis]|uniref:Zf-RVT domain-containing protein n=1 Tax=Cephalotus follicularis TaxID=3775 RepID=A0A1Q3DA37_CEPFO|nr:zf-RVT domain-containing protein [Cephalotus follicularis]